MLLFQNHFTSEPLTNQHEVTTWIILTLFSELVKPSNYFVWSWSDALTLTSSHQLIRPIQAQSFHILQLSKLGWPRHDDSPNRPTDKWNRQHTSDEIHAANEKHTEQIKRSRTIETHRGRGDPDAGCEDPCGAINGYLIVPTPTSDELSVWSFTKQMSCKEKQALPPPVNTLETAIWGKYFRDSRQNIRSAGGGVDFCPRSWISISWPLQKIVSVQVLKQADCALCKETCFKFRFWFSRSRAELWSKISPHLLHSPRWQENSNSSTCQKDLPGFCYLSEPPVSPSFLPVVHSPWNDQRVQLPAPRDPLNSLHLWDKRACRQ